MPLALLLFALAARATEESGDWPRTNDAVFWMRENLYPKILTAYGGRCFGIPDYLQSRNVGAPNGIRHWQQKFEFWKLRIEI